MYQMILAVFGIAMVSAVTALGVTHVPMEAFQKKQLVTAGEASIEALAQATKRYLDDHRDIDGVVVIPEQAQEDILAAVTPVYGFVPPVIQGMGWSMGVGALYGQAAVSICMRPESAAQSAVAASLPILQGRLPQASAFVANECGATSDQAGGTSLTYWMLLSHFD